MLAFKGGVYSGCEKLVGGGGYPVGELSHRPGMFVMRGYIVFFGVT